MSSLNLKPINSIEEYFIVTKSLVFCVEDNLISAVCFLAVCGTLKLDNRPHPSLVTLGM